MSGSHLRMRTQALTRICAVQYALCDTFIKFISRNKKKLHYLNLCVQCKITMYYFDSYTCVTCEGIFIDMEAYNNHKCEPCEPPESCEQPSEPCEPCESSKKIGKDESFYWNHNATLGLLAAYNAMQPDKENVRKQRNFWQNLAKELQKLGYNVTADQTRWKFNALLKKYKECVDNNSKSGRSPMTFAYFDEMQDMFGHRKNINCNHVIGSSFIGKKDNHLH